MHLVQDLRSGLVNLPLRLRQSGTLSSFSSKFLPTAKTLEEKKSPFLVAFRNDRGAGLK